MGPSPMALGPHTFEALGFAFTDISEDVDTPWREVEVAMRAEVLQWLGPKNDQFTIKGALFPEEFGGLDTLDALKRDAKAGLPMMMVTRDGTIHGLMAVQKITAERSAMKGDASPRKVTYSIVLKRYVPVGAVGAVAGLLE